MAISRAQLVKELEPGLNAIFGMEYDRYDNEHAEIYDTESSDRAFEISIAFRGTLFPYTTLFRSMTVTTMSMQKSMRQNLQTERLKKK